MEEMKNDKSIPKITEHLVILKSGFPSNYKKIIQFKWLQKHIDMKDSSARWFLCFGVKINFKYFTVWKIDITEDLKK